MTRRVTFMLLCCLCFTTSIALAQAIAPRVLINGAELHVSVLQVNGTLLPADARRL